MSATESLNQIVADGDIFGRFLKGGADETIETEGGPIPTLANFLASTSAKLAAETDKMAQSLIASSNGAQTVGLGDKTFLIQSGKKFIPNQWLIATSGAASMIGTVKSYTGNTLVLTVAKTIGAGTATSWNLGISGPIGPEGPPGDDGDDGGGTGPSAPSSKLFLKMAWDPA